MHTGVITTLCILHYVIIVIRTRPLITTTSTRKNVKRCTFDIVVMNKPTEKRNVN